LMIMTRIIIFGASITYGAWDKEGGWTRRLRKFLDKKTLSDTNTYFIIYNLGVSGDTTEDLIERVEFETKQRLKEGEETIFIFSIGTTDSQFIDMDLVL
ncbi:MAG: SGNH/GDSL hydrolase family protein, partial [Methanosarcinales archaeon]